MHTTWWSLPGPSAFVEDIIETVRTGINVVVCLPDHIPENLRSTLRSSMDDGERLSFEAIDISSEKGSDPLGVLFSRFVSHQRRRPSLTCEDLCREDAFAGKLVWIDGLANDSWPVWRAFIEEYSHACRSFGIIFRTKICIVLRGELALQPPKEDVCLRNLVWRGRVSWYDIFLYTSIAFRDSTLPDLVKGTAISICSKLALWDPAVVDLLAQQEDTERIFAPNDILKEISLSRNWYWNSQEGVKPCWHNGSLDLVDGYTQVHSALLACLPDGRRVMNRLWSAQVGVILPFVEERRIELVETLAPFLKVPFTTRFGETIKDVRDLEIGHIELQLGSSNEGFDWDLLRFIGKLREMRNALAHGEPVQLAALESDELLEYRRILEPFKRDSVEKAGSFPFTS